MNHAGNLNTVLEVATRKRDHALQLLARAQHEQQQALMQMSQLQGYTAESQQRWAKRATLGVTATLLQTQQTFMGKLEHAVSFQNGMLERHAQNVQRCRLQLQETERELASLRKYQQRRLEAWQKVQHRQEQKTNDEMAATQHRHHTHAHPWSPIP